MSKYFKYIGNTDEYLKNGKIYKGCTNPYTGEVIVYTDIFSSSTRLYKMFEFLLESAEKDYILQKLQEYLETAKTELKYAEIKIETINKKIDGIKES